MKKFDIKCNVCGSTASILIKAGYGELESCLIYCDNLKCENFAEQFNEELKVK